MRVTTGGIVTILPPLRVIARVRCPADAEGLDIRASGLRDPQPGGDRQRAEFVAV